MTTTPSRTGEIKIAAETVANEAIADPATWATTAKAIRAWDVDTSSLKYASEKDPALRPRAFQRGPNILTAKQGTLAFKCFLAGLNQAAADGTAVTQDNLGLLLATALGGENLGTTRAIGAGSTTTTITIATTAGLVVGAAVMINGEARRILTVTPNTSIVLDMALSAVPAEGVLCKAAATYYPDESALTDLADAAHHTLAVLFRGYHAEDQWLLRGVWPQIELDNLGTNKPLQLQVTCHPQDYDMVTGVTVGTTPAERAPAIQRKGALYYQAVATTTRNVANVRNVGIKLGMAVTPYDSVVGENGVAGHLVLGIDPTLECEWEYDDDHRAAHEALTNKFAGYQCNDGIMISFPSLYLDDSPQRTGNGPTGSKCIYHPDEGGVTTNDLTRAIFAFHRFAY